MVAGGSCCLSLAVGARCQYLCMSCSRLSSSSARQLSGMAAGAPLGVVTSSVRRYPLTPTGRHRSWVVGYFFTGGMALWRGWRRREGEGVSIHSGECSLLCVSTLHLGGRRLRVMVPSGFCCNRRSLPVMWCELLGMSLGSKRLRQVAARE